MTESVKDVAEHIDKKITDNIEDTIPKEEASSSKEEIIVISKENDSRLVVNIENILSDLKHIDTGQVVGDSCLSLLNSEQREYSEAYLDEPLSKIQENNSTNSLSENPLNLGLPHDHKPGNPTEIKKIGSVDNISRSTEEYLYNKQENSEVFSDVYDSSHSDRLRRNSLPENSCNAISTDKLDTLSVGNFECGDHFSKNSAPPRVAPSLHSERRNIAPDLKNLSHVVKNVHGLFSNLGGSLKSAYKPMEKNIGDMMLATQKNFTRNGYLLKNGDSKNIQSNKSAVENISKYSTLRLSSENVDLDSCVFSKCDKFTTNETKEIKNGSTDREKTHFEYETYSEKNNQLTSISENKQKFNSKSGDIYEVNDKISNVSPDICNLKSKEYDERRPLKIKEECENLKRNTFEDISPIKENKNGEVDNVRNSPDGQVDGSSSVNDDADITTILERAILEQNQQLEVLKGALQEKDSLKKDLEVRIQTLIKQLESLAKERDASVMRYAVSERGALEAMRARDAAIATEKEAKTEAGLLSQRLRAAHADRTRICTMFHDKADEVTAAQKEAARFKEELAACEVKLKWAHAKLASESEALKEADRLSLVPSPADSAMLKEKEAAVIMATHEKERSEARCRTLFAENEKLKAAVVIYEDESRELHAQVESGAAGAEALRGACAELREQSARDCERLAAAQARAARVDTLTAHLQQEQEKCLRLEQELAAEKLARSEALADAELSCRREAELLRQAERLTGAGVRLQASCSEAEAKALALSVDNVSLRAAAAKSAAESAAERAAAENERTGRAADARALASAAARHARAERAALAQLEAKEGDERAREAKHASAIKELKREIQQWKRKYERLESECHSSRSVLQTPSHRTGSCSSLSSFEGAAHHSSHTDAPDAVPDVHVHAPDRQQLVERIVQLQRAAARRGERVEFLEEHSAQLTRELQNKSRLLRALLANTPAGALASAASDQAKPANGESVQAEIGKHGGIMSSVFGSQVTDETMTIELSLEINAKLQSVLEDALLKNITLKENMDTLGDEIARLKEELDKRIHK